MNCVEYSEKEIAIINGLVDLIRSGANPHSIKVSDIATAANVGKGTIYDYFTSKEEAISKAIIFSITNEIKSTYLQIDSELGFKNKFLVILEIIGKSTDNNLCTFKMLLSSGGMQEFYDHLVDKKFNIIDCVNLINKIIDDLIEEGFKEGIIKTKEEKYYQNMAVRATIAGFAGYVNHMEMFPSTSMEQAKEAAYRMLIKALN